VQHVVAAIELAAERVLEPGAYASSLNGRQTFRSFRRIAPTGARSGKLWKRSRPAGAASVSRARASSTRSRGSSLTVRHDTDAPRASRSRASRWNQRAAVSPNGSGAAGKTSTARITPPSSDRAAIRVDRLVGHRRPVERAARRSPRARRSSRRAASVVTIRSSAASSTGLDGSNSIAASPTISGIAVRRAARSGVPVAIASTSWKAERLPARRVHERRRAAIERRQLVRLRLDAVEARRARELRPRRAQRGVGVALRRDDDEVVVVELRAVERVDERADVLVRVVAADVEHVRAREAVAAADGVVAGVRGRRELGGGAR
jgi:hypothetical protein